MRLLHPLALSAPALTKGPVGFVLEDLLEHNGAQDEHPVRKVPLTIGAAVVRSTPMFFAFPRMVRLQSCRIAAEVCVTGNAIAPKIDTGHTARKVDFRRRTVSKE